MKITEDQVQIGLRAIRDCGVVRASFTNPLYRALVDRNLATPSLTGKGMVAGLRDYRLTGKGRILVQRLPPLPVA